MKVLVKTQFGNPVLRQPARLLKVSEIHTNKTQTLIKNMKYTLVKQRQGIGLAAPQVGKDIALAVIAIRPTKHRPKVRKFDLVIINPKIVKTYGAMKDRWEGCLSAGESGLFAKLQRHDKIEVSFIDENGQQHQKQFSGLKSQVLQHEIDHINGILFMDRVTSPATYMTLSEYQKRVVARRNPKTVK